MKPTERELIAARDHDAMARFYDRHVAMVGEFCRAVCPDERVDEVVAARCPAPEASITGRQG
jgi:hypothetical protein